MYATVNLSLSIIMNAFDSWDPNLNLEHFTNLNQLLLEGPTFQSTMQMLPSSRTLPNRK